VIGVVPRGYNGMAETPSGGETVDAWLDPFVRILRNLYRDEAGQEVLTWLLIIFVLWLIIAGRRLIVQ